MPSPRKVIGALLVEAMVVVPAAAARNLAMSVIFFVTLVLGGIRALAGRATP